MDDMKKKSIDDFMTYSVAVIKSRALPKVEDNLKPVHRRILYVMFESKLWSKNKTVKSVAVVGDTMKSYHPHGDSSIYDAMVRLGQPWKMRYPLIEFQGNCGSVNGDPAAAMRYTECKLSKVGDYMLKNLDDKVVPFAPNYNDDTTEPTLLPSIFPNTLCNGNDGIAVGMSSGILPHNLTEAVALLSAIVDNPNLTLDEALAIMPGPDFPLGGRVIDGYKLREAYATGQGTITLRAKYEVNGNVIKFYETPYLVDIDNRIIASIKKMAQDDELPEVEDVENHIGKGNCHINVVLAKNANPTKVIEKLLKKTGLEKTVKINHTVIHNGIPVTMSLLGLCKTYLEHQHTCITNMAIQEKAKQEKIAHINRGLEIATRSIDECIKIIRASDTKEIAKQGLIKLLGIDSEQADAVLALTLSRLTRLDVNDIIVKIQNAEKAIAYQTSIIKEKAVRNGLIKENLAEMKTLFGDARRTTIDNISGPSAEQVAAENNTRRLVVVGRDLSVTEVETDVDAADFKKGAKYAKLDPKFIMDTDKEVVYVGSDSSGTSTPDTSTVGIMAIDRSKEVVLTISKGGTIKKTLMSEYKNFSKLGKVRANDEIVGAVCANNSDKIIVTLETGKAISLAVSDIKSSGKLTIGNKATSAAIVLWCVGGEKDLFYTCNEVNQVKVCKFGEIGSVSTSLNEGVKFLGTCGNNWLYNGKLEQLDWSTYTPKGRTATGAKASTKAIEILA